MAEQSRQAWYQQILKDTDGMTQEQRWEYYDKHPGSHDVVFEFRHRSVVTDTVDSFDSAAQALGLKDEVEAIDRATDKLGAVEYTSWLDSHPSAKQTLMKIQELMDTKK